jgi:uncharacterized protein (UPF0261 family)
LAGRPPCCCPARYLGHRQGQPFDDPPARAALFQSLKESHIGVELVELDRHINDPPFAEPGAHKLLERLAIGCAAPAAMP